MTIALSGANEELLKFMLVEHILCTHFGTFTRGSTLGGGGSVGVAPLGMPRS